MTLIAPPPLVLNIPRISHYWVSSSLHVWCRSLYATVYDATYDTFWHIGGAPDLLAMCPGFKQFLKRAPFIILSQRTSRVTVWNFPQLPSGWLPLPHNAQASSTAAVYDLWVALCGFRSDDAES